MRSRCATQRADWDRRQRFSLGTLRKPTFLGREVCLRLEVCASVTIKEVLQVLQGTGARNTRHTVVILDTSSQPRAGLTTQEHMRGCGTRRNNKNENGTQKSKNALNAETRIMPQAHRWHVRVPPVRATKTDLCAVKLVRLHTAPSLLETSSSSPPPSRRGTGSGA